MVLRRTFEPKRDKVTGEWRKLHNEELMICTAYPIFFSGNQIEKNEIGGQVPRMREREEMHKGFGGET